MKDFTKEITTAFSKHIPKELEPITVSHERMQKYIKHGTELPTDTLKDIRVKRLGNLRGFTVWLVDGELIRDELDIDFTMGGNPSRYGYVPPGEIWIEQNMDVVDVSTTCLHEIIEAVLMSTRKYDYDSAHDIASNVELQMRHSIENSNVGQPLITVDAWLDNEYGI